MQSPRWLTDEEYYCLQTLITQAMQYEREAVSVGRAMSADATDILLGLAGLFQVSYKEISALIAARGHDTVLQTNHDNLRQLKLVK